MAVGEMVHGSDERDVFSRDQMQSIQHFRVEALNTRAAQSPTMILQTSASVKPRALYCKWRGPDRILSRAVSTIGSKGRMQ